MIKKIKTRKLLYFIAAACLIASAAVLIINFARSGKDDFMKINLEVTSTAFKNDETIPAIYTGRGEDISPPIKIKGVASKGKTIAIVMDDPDAPMGVFTHWLIWNIPATFTSIPAGIPKKEVISSLGDAYQGKNDFNRIGYNGPLPPSGTHVYRIKAFVLDTVLSLNPGADKSAFQNAIKGHIQQYGLLRGKFSH